MLDIIAKSVAAAALPLGQALLMLFTAAVLGAALGIVRPVRRGIVPRPAHVIHAQILLAIVGTTIMIVVAESLARAFAVVGAAGLVRYRAQIDDPKDAGVMLVTLAVGLAVGVGHVGFAIVATGFSIAVLWVLESFEPAARSRFDLRICPEKDATKLQAAIEHALRQRGVTFELRGSSHDELHYEVTVPFKEEIRGITKAIKKLSGKNGGTTVEWEIRKVVTVQS